MTESIVSLLFTMGVAGGASSKAQVDAMSQSINNLGNLTNGYTKSVVGSVKANSDVSDSFQKVKSNSNYLGSFSKISEESAVASTNLKKAADGVNIVFSKQGQIISGNKAELASNISLLGKATSTVGAHATKLNALYDKRSQIRSSLFPAPDNMTLAQLDNYIKNKDKLVAATSLNLENKIKKETIAYKSSQDIMQKQSQIVSELQAKQTLLQKSTAMSGKIEDFKKTADFQEIGLITSSKRLTEETKLTKEMYRQGLIDKDTLSLSANAIKLQQSAISYQKKLDSGKVFDLNTYGKAIDNVNAREKNGIINIQQALKERVNIGNKVIKGGLNDPSVIANTKQWREELDKSNGSMNSGIAKMAKWAIGWTLMYSAIRMVQQGFMSLISTTIEYDKTVNMFAAIMQGSRGEAAKLIDTGLQLGVVYGRSFKEVAGAMELWVRQGKSVSDTMMLTKQSLMLATIGAIDDTKATDILTSVLAEFNLEAKDAARVVDILSLLDKRYAISTAELGNALKVVGPLAHEYGLSLEETAGTITAIVHTTRLGATQVGNALKTIFTRIHRPEVIKNLYEMAGVVSRTKDGFADLGIVFSQLSSKWEYLGDDTKQYLSQQVAGIRQIAVFEQMMKSFAISQEATKIAFNSLGSAERSFEQITQSLSLKIKSLQTEISIAAIKMGEGGLNPAIASTLESIKALIVGLDLVAPLIGKTFAVGKWVVEFGLVTAGIWGIAFALGKLGPALTIVTTQWKAFNVVTMKNPVLLAIAGLIIVADIARQGIDKGTQASIKAGNASLAYAGKLQVLVDKHKELIKAGIANANTMLPLIRATYEYQQSIDNLDKAIKHRTFFAQDKIENSKLFKQLYADLISGDEARIIVAKNVIKTSEGQASVEAELIWSLKEYLLALGESSKKLTDSTVVDDKLTQALIKQNNALDDSYDKLNQLNSGHDTFLKSLENVIALFEKQGQVMTSTLDVGLGKYPTLSAMIDTYNKKIEGQKSLTKDYQSIIDNATTAIDGFNDSLFNKQGNNDSLMTQLKGWKGMSDAVAALELYYETSEKVRKGEMDHAQSIPILIKAMGQLSDIKEFPVPTDGDKSIIDQAIANNNVIKSFQKTFELILKDTMTIQENTIKKNESIKTTFDLGRANDTLSKTQRLVNVELNKSYGNITDWQAAVQEATINLDGLTKGSDEARKVIDTLNKTWAGMVKSISDAMKSTFETGISDAVTAWSNGINDMTDIGKTFARSMADIWQKMWVEDLVRSMHTGIQKVAEGVANFANPESIFIPLTRDERIDKALGLNNLQPVILAKSKNIDEGNTIGKGFGNTAYRMSPLIGTIIGKSFAHAGRESSAAIGTQIGMMMGQAYANSAMTLGTMGPLGGMGMIVGGAIIGSLLGNILGTTESTSQNTEQTTTELTKISDTLAISHEELSIVNRNLVAMRQSQQPYGIREAFFYRGLPSLAGGGSILETGAAIVHKGESVGKPVTGNTIIVNVKTDANPNEIAEAVNNVLITQSVRGYAG